MRLNLKRLGLLCGRAARASARLAQLTSARADLLISIVKGERIQAEIAAILCVTPPVVSRMLRALEDQGLVQRRRAPHDARCKLVSLTAEGERRLAQSIAHPMDPELDDAVSTQCDGETQWMRYWAPALEPLGVEVRSVLRHAPLPLSVFRSIQRWNRTHLFDDFYGSVA